MVIAGAGGHALEVLDIFLKNKNLEELFFFDNINQIDSFQKKFKVINNTTALKLFLSTNPLFILGVGDPKKRNDFYTMFKDLGGELVNVVSKDAFISEYSKIDNADIMYQSFIGSNCIISEGSLINTRAQIHHEVQIGRFSEINPSAVILGKAKIGDFTIIGSNSTILPSVRIGNKVIVGAGAVVINDLPDNCVAVGVPAKIIKYNE